VVNKSDRDGADKFAAGLIRTLHERPMGTTDWVIPVIKTIASRQEGIAELINSIHQHTKLPAPQQRISLLAERAFRLIQHERMKGISVAEIQEQLSPVALKADFNLYRFIDQWK
jgi:LAO/AO transport system kinase